MAPRALFHFAFGSRGKRIELPAGGIWRPGCSEDTWIRPESFAHFIGLRLKVPSDCVDRPKVPLLLGQQLANSPDESYVSPNKLIYIPNEQYALLQRFFDQLAVVAGQ